ncbi:MAG: hypothetical protein RI842_09130 [Schleiferiaceae bacterium]|nr:hypothetical protein [Schleiferiaceae bacterium]MDR9442871.1 hypothetical protein [Schleiferiaceae bacterium]
MIRAVIDCGTNTFNLLIWDTRREQYLHREKYPVRLGEGGQKEKIISPEAQSRALKTLQKYQEQAQKWGADSITVVGTAMIREARNGGDLVRAVKKETGLSLQVIDGQREAALILQGVQQAMPLPRDSCLIMDIGGGSTEFIWLKAQKAQYLASFPLGSSLLLEKCRPSDPIEPAEIEAMENFIAATLAPLLSQVRGAAPVTLIGSSGSFDTLAQMCALRFKTWPWQAEDRSYTFALPEYHEMARLMLTQNLEERLHTPGMIPMRADMIVPACVLINFIIKRMGIQTLMQCSYALKEGVFYSLENEPHLWPKS